MIHVLIRDMAFKQRAFRLSLRHNHTAPDSCGAASPSVVIVWTSSLPKLLAHDNLRWDGLVNNSAQR